MVHSDLRKENLGEEYTESLGNQKRKAAQPQEHLEPRKLGHKAATLASPSRRGCMVPPPHFPLHSCFTSEQQCLLQGVPGCPAQSSNGPKMLCPDTNNTHRSL